MSWTGIGEQTESTRIAVNTLIREEAARTSAATTFLVDLAGLCEADKSETMTRPDGMHFAAIGYHRLGEEAAESVKGWLSHREQLLDARILERKSEYSR